MLECRKQVLIITYVYPPDNYVGAARPHRFVKYLRRRGFAVRVLSSAAVGACSTVDDIYRVRGEIEHAPSRTGWFWTEWLIRQLALPYDEGITWVPRVTRLVRKWEHEGIYANSPPVLISTSPPLTTHLAALMLKRRFGWQWIADFRDPVIGNPCRGPKSARMDAYLEGLYFRHADALIANTDAVAVMWKHRRPEWSDKIHVIYNGFDPEILTPALPLPERTRRVLSHVGNLYGGRYPSALFRSFERLISSGKLDPDGILLRMAGPASEPRDRDGSHRWIEFLPGQLPRREAERVAAESDWLLLLDFDTPLLGDHPGLQVPAKLYDYLGVGRPILACTRKGSPVQYVLERAGVPYRCFFRGAPDEENDRSVLDFLQLPSEPVATSQWFDQNFHPAAQAEQLEKIIAGLTTGC